MQDQRSNPYLWWSREAFEEIANFEHKIFKIGQNMHQWELIENLFAKIRYMLGIWIWRITLQPVLFIRTQSCYKLYHKSYVLNLIILIFLFPLRPLNRGEVWKDVSAFDNVAVQILVQRLGPHYKVRSSRGLGTILQLALFSSFFMRQENSQLLPLWF